MNVPLVAQWSEASHQSVKHRSVALHRKTSVPYSVKCVDEQQSRCSLLLCCADTATIHVHAVSFSQPLCRANFYKNIYSSKVSVETKYCNRTFDFMFWSLRFKYTLQVCTHLPLQCFCQIKTIFVSFEPKESREFRVF